MTKRELETHTHKHTHAHTHTHTDRQTDRQRNTEGEAERDWVKEEQSMVVNALNGERSG